MPVSRRLQRLVQAEIISLEQAEKIMLFESSNSNEQIWKRLYWLAGLLFGLGIILVISANWFKLGSVIKFGADFAISGACIAGACWTYQQEKKNLNEMFLILCFLMVGATIGLASQIFHLQGGWESFALSWALLTIPYIFFSKLVPVHILWLLLFGFGMKVYELVERILDYFDFDTLSLMFVATACLGLVSFLSQKLYELIQEKNTMPRALAVFCNVSLYISLFSLSIFESLDGLFGNYYRGNIFPIHCFIFVFLAARLALAFYSKNNKSFRNNTVLAECYILYIFFSQFYSLLTTGIGFIIGGVILLVGIYLLKQSSNYIKQMEFK